MGLKPIISIIDAETSVVEKIRGEKNIVPRVVEVAKSKMVPKSPYCLLYGSNLQHLEDLRATATKVLGYPPEEVFQIGATVSCHAGSDVAGIVLKGESRAK
jgi:fatty acid-binding protein DegV